MPVIPGYNLSWSGTLHDRVKTRVTNRCGSRINANYGRAVRVNRRYLVVWNRL